MPTIYRIKEATKFLGISKATLLTLKKEGKIAFVQLSKGRIGYLEADLQAYLNRNRQTQGGTAA